MRISNFSPVHITSIECIEAGPRGSGTRRVSLNVELVRVNSLPDGVDALIVTSDLQAREIDANGNCDRLFGCAVAEELASLISCGALDVGPNVGVMLCGDLYTVPNAKRRGGLGDVGDVWRAIADNFSWVAGVLGNHDMLGKNGTLPKDIERAHLLDGNTAEVGGLSIGGVSGIAGMLTKPNRKDSETFINLLDRVVTAGCDAVLLHESPSCFGARRGSNAIRDYLELAGDTYDDEAPIVFCGHTYWENPFVELRGGVQVLNVGHRLFILTT